MLLSIIVPTYNVEKFIANCLESLLDQDIPKESYEILVINDGSKDDSAKIASIYCNNHNNVILVNQENKGLSGARNTGLSLAKGKYIYFIDSDDYIAKNTLGMITSLLEEHNLDVLGTGVIETPLLDIKLSANAGTINTKDLKVTDGITYIAENNYMNNAWWYFIRLDFLKETGLVFPVGRLVEDANFTAKLLVAASRMAYLPVDFYRYYMRPNSIMRKKNIPHIKRLVHDYEKNVHEFNEQLTQLKEQGQHPKLDSCIERLEARQQSFAFFLLVKSLRFGLPKEEVSEIVDGLKDINAYPIKRFLGRDYKNLSYKMLLPILNNEKLLFSTLKLSSLVN